MSTNGICAACAQRACDGTATGCRNCSPPHDQPYFRAVVFESAPASEDFAQSHPVKLPDRTDRATAWQRLMNALRGDRSLVGGTVQESGWRPWG